MGGDPAELAYGHALAMLGDPSAAEQVAVAALRHAGRSRTLVLAHARHQAVARAAQDEPLDIHGSQLLVLDLPALAATLASTRPPEERAALDCRARTAGDLSALGDALGMRPSSAADKCSEIAELWERRLDPALLAFSGPGECAGLAEILAETPETVGDLLEVAPLVADHVPDCTLCADRVRSMASVRTFFSAARPDVPADVRAVGHVSRRRRPAAPPPPLFEETPDLSRRLVIRPQFAALVAVIALVGLTAWFVAGRNGDGNEQVAALTKVSPASSLELFAPEVTNTVARFRLQNPTDFDITYRVTSSAAWASIEPVAGRIPSYGNRTLVVTALDGAPEGDSRSQITVTPSRGAPITHEIKWTIERAPDVAATAQGCAVDVHVVEEGGLTSLVLHWRDDAEHEIVLDPSLAEGARAELRPEGQPITYWVTATDARGNQARTADQVIPPGAC